MSNIQQTRFLPDWRQLCQAAMLERDPVKLLDRVASARSAVLDRIEDRSYETGMANNTICEML